MNEFYNFDWINKHHDKLDAEFKRLVNDMPYKEVYPGDHVLVACGLLGRGHLWIRKECEVIQVANNSVKVKCTEGDNYKWEEWIHAALITDVIGRTERARKGGSGERKQRDA